MSMCAHAPLLNSTESTPLCVNWPGARRLEGSSIEVIGGINRPPFEREQSAALFDRATALAADLGLPAPEGVSVGGASDGNFTAGDGIATLDGLGAVGDGAHAEHEHAVIDEIAPRTALLAALIADQLQG